MRSPGFARSVPRWRAISLGLLALFMSGSLAAQTVARADAQAAFYAEPGETLLATLEAGERYRLGERRGAWQEVILEGWIWSASVGPDARNGHDLGVAAAGGENLRAEPNGRVLARLRTGMLLDRIEDGGSWVRVRRRGWVESSAFAAAGAVEPTAAGGRAAASDDSGVGWSRTGDSPTPLLGAPAGDTVAVVREAAQLRVLERDGNWARVRIDGWISGTALDAPLDSGTVLRDVAPATLAANPAAFEGRFLEWTVQFIALERAEAIRTDFREGEPFILARGPGQTPGFVYIAVPPDLQGRVAEIQPLDPITVLARVRTARSALLASPVLDLLELR